MSNSNKIIIQVGGSNRSGSTILNLILANDPQAMALGEIINLFYPVYKHQVVESRKLRNDPVWGPIIKDGSKNLFKNLIQTFPEIKYFIDSSKDPKWYNDHKHANPELDFRDILIFKHPVDMKASYEKRQTTGDWKLVIMNYYRRYIYSIKDFKSVSLSELINEPLILKSICEYLDLPYFIEKYHYWKKEQPNFLGSTTINKKTIDKSNITPLKTKEDLNTEHFMPSKPMRNLYEHLIAKAIWNKDYFSSYKISKWTQLYIEIRFFFSIKRARLLAFFNGDYKK